MRRCHFCHPCQNEKCLICVLFGLKISPYIVFQGNSFSTAHYYAVYLCSRSQWAAKQWSNRLLDRTIVSLLQLTGLKSTTVPVALSLFCSSFPPSSVILNIHQVTSPLWMQETRRRWTFSVLSLLLHISRLLPLSLLLRLPSVWRNLFPWWLPLLQMRWLQHPI